jgi:hypothetical protein
MESGSVIVVIVIATLIAALIASRVALYYHKKVIEMLKRAFDLRGMIIECERFGDRPDFPRIDWPALMHLAEMELWDEFDELYRKANKTLDMHKLYMKAKYDT